MNHCRSFHRKEHKHGFNDNDGNGSADNANGSEAMPEELLRVLVATAAGRILNSDGH